MDRPLPPAAEWCGREIAAWAGAWGVPELRVFRRVGSTNDVARRLAEDGAPPGTTVIADEQTRGRGRRGREWVAPAGAGLLMSLVLRPGGSSAGPLLPLRLGLATAHALEDVAPLRVAIKWPNDLVVDGRKLGGVLCEAARAPGRTLYVIAGFGINLVQRDDDWPAHLADAATSVAAATGALVERAQLVGRIIHHVRAAQDADPAALRSAELRELARRDALLGRSVAVDGRPAGIVAGIAADGALRIRDHSRERRVLAGTVRLVTDDGAEPS